MNAEKMSHSRSLDAVLAGSLWRAAHYWIGVWTGAGFPPKVDGEKIVMTKSWAEKFPDGPMLVGALRKELTGLLTKGNAAVADDPRLHVPDYGPLYLEYLNERYTGLSRESAQARRYAEFWEHGNEKYPADPETAAQARKAVADKDRVIEQLRAEIARLKKR